MRRATFGSDQGHDKDNWCHYVYVRYPKLKKRIEAEQAAVWANKPDEDKFEIKRAGAFGGRNTYGPLLVMLKADKQAVLVSGSLGKNAANRISSHR